MTSEYSSSEHLFNSYFSHRSANLSTETDDNGPEEAEEKRSVSILDNPAKFEALVKFGRGLQELAQQVWLVTQYVR